MKKSENLFSTLRRHYPRRWGPFSGVAIKFISDHLAGDNVPDDVKSEAAIGDMLNESGNLQIVRNIDRQFKLEMQKLGVDVFALEMESGKEGSAAKAGRSPQVVISVLFLTAYFLMLAAIFLVEASDSVNMTQGENSLMGELQILFGVLTAGVGQILSFWFGGALPKKDLTSKPAQVSDSTA